MRHLLSSYDSYVVQGLAVLTEYKQDKLPLVIANDATAVAPRLDIAVRGEEIWAYGLCGGEVKVESVSHLRELVKSHGLAQQLDVYVAIASAPHGMHLPIFANATNGKLKAADVRRNMELVFSELEARGAVVMAHVADGASTNRQVWGVGVELHGTEYRFGSHGFRGTRL